MENIIYLKDLDLEDLEDITDSLSFPLEPSIFEGFEEQFVESCLILMEEYTIQNPSFISDPDFRELLEEEIEELIFIQLEEAFNIYEEEQEKHLIELLEFAFEMFFSLFIQERSLLQESSSSSFPTKYDLKDIDSLTLKIENLKAKPQPPQRTKEWYDFRYNLITASNAFKAFESQSMQNQLIYEKCLPLKVFDQDISKPSMVNTNSTLHWGQKYEPLSVLIYEEMYETKVDDFGCIQHEKYSFLGASPDGINVDQTSNRFGRMLEIKNIVNREINGIPKKEYWIQMQLQMEVCDLEECDFLETKFTEYENAESFYKNLEKEFDKNFDKESEPNNSNTFLKQGFEFNKGIIIYFNTKDSKPFYVYKPLNIVLKEEIQQWEEEMVDKYESEAFQMIYIKNIYWKLEKLSCVLVQRNKIWFETNIGQLENIWKIIEKERITGYEHRAPNKRIKNEQNTKITSFLEKEEGCLINLNKISCFNKEKLIIQKLDFKDDFFKEEENIDIVTSIKQNNSSDPFTKIIHIDFLKN